MLDIGTGALALLAIFAAEAGAEHVYAFEVNMEAAIAARAPSQKLASLIASPFWMASPQAET